ncbi:MAG: hypothetical protein Q9M14_03975 [Mariprofundaceae bacterium]|nr:hypothetical protein [Mariprofundaceae bacterium]
MQSDDEHNDEYHWNKRQNKRDWGLYLLVGSVCLFLGWLLGGAA